MRRTSVGTGNNKGFTLFEVAVALTAVALLTTAAIPYFIRQAETAAAQKTAKEISTIQEAAKWYYVNSKAWPASVGNLQASGFLNPAWSPVNPWGNGYSISTSGTGLTVTTYVPDNVGGILTRALPGVSSWSSGSFRGVNSTIPVPGQEASLTGVTNLANNAQNTANTALSMAQSSAVPPGAQTTVCGWACGGGYTGCPDGYVMVGVWDTDGSGNEATAIQCAKIKR